MNADPLDLDLYLVVCTYNTPWWCPSEGFIAGETRSIHTDLEEAKAAADAIRDDPESQVPLIGAMVELWRKGVQVMEDDDGRPANVIYHAAPVQTNGLLECPACDWLEARYGWDGWVEHYDEAHADITYPGCEWDVPFADEWRPIWLREPAPSPGDPQ
jgi:hypothetical protein